MQQSVLPVLAVIVPCYNEQEVLPRSVATLTSVLARLKAEQKVSAESYVCLVDDGSRDATWPLIAQLAVTQGPVKGIKLSNNFGHQNALLAGLFTEQDEADCFVTIDADLQDDPSVIGQMVDLYRGGHKVVYGVRSDR